MSYNGSGIQISAACANLQEVIQNTCAVNSRDKIGFTQFILDGQRNNVNPIAVGFEQDGRSKVLRVKYRPRSYNSSADVISVCDTLPNSTALGFDITQDMLMTANAVEQFSLEDIRILCETPSAFKAQTFNNMFNDVWVQINKKNIDYINGIAPFLANNEGSGQFTIDLLQGSPPAEQVATREYNKVRRGIENMSCGPRFGWIGQAEELDVAVTKLNLGCCDINGLDLSKMNDSFAYYYDSYMNAGLGMNHTIASAYGAIQILPYYRNIGEYAGLFGGDLVRERVVDPVTNQFFDVEIKEESCGPNNEPIVKIRISLSWFLFTLPEDLYFNGDSLYRTKGFLRPIVI
jgi:hypothetical protein